MADFGVLVPHFEKICHALFPAQVHQGGTGTTGTDFRFNRIKALLYRAFLAPFFVEVDRDVTAVFQSQWVALRLQQDCPAPLAWAMERTKIPRNVSPMMAISGPRSSLQHTRHSIKTLDVAVHDGPLLLVKFALATTALAVLFEESNLKG
ncbi:hypothetical protein BJY52DRAFT_1223449 [Lactarius psammicola]|nr:hypothetical protein BJY52DRAFT_1223449 [Lactarius psammicola]